MNNDNIWPEERKLTGQPGGCLKGCVILGVIATVAALVVVGTIAYFGWKFVNEGISEDPVKVNAWLQEVVTAEVPPGYEVKMGMRWWAFKLIVVGPEGKRITEEGQEDFTQFMVSAVPGVDFDTLKQEFKKNREHRNGRRQQEDLSEEDVELTIGTQTRTGQKHRWTDQGVEWTEYDVLLKPGVLFVAMGPTEDFDEGAMKAFLASVKTNAEEPETPAQGVEPAEKVTPEPAAPGDTP